MKVILLDGLVQRRRSQISHGIYVSASFNQRYHIRDVSSIRSKMKRAIAKSPHLIHVCEWLTEVR